jgi:hypothetical protein
MPRTFCGKGEHYMDIKARSIGWLYNSDSNTVTLTIVPAGRCFPVRKVVSKKDFFAVKNNKEQLENFIKKL